MPPTCQTDPPLREKRMEPHVAIIQGNSRISGRLRLAVKTQGNSSARASRKREGPRDADHHIVPPDPPRTGRARSLSRSQVDAAAGASDSKSLHRKRPHTPATPLFLH